MFDIPTMKKLFRALNDELEKMHIVGEMGICGGAVMCLVFKARPATKDIDAIFEPPQQIRTAAARVAKKFGIDEHWLNDAVKGFFSVDPPKQPVLELSHLRIWAPRADYMLAMKCVSARFDTHDKDDVIFLIRHLGLNRPAQVFAIIEKYYPKQTIPPKTQFLIEEVLAEAATK